MKFIHLADLHLGKRVHEQPMIDDQEYILDEITEIIEKEAPDAVLIAGDVYDKGIPSTEAMGLFDDFLVGLSKKKIPVYIISGNHDSAERLSFASRLIETTGIHICPAYDGKTVRYTLEDEHGPVNVYLLPFIKPASVRAVHGDAEIGSYTDAVKIAVSDMNVNTSERNVLVAHQFVTGAERCDSEEMTIGGLDNVDASVFDCFDYVALGHIHSPQDVGNGKTKIRYCGTPLKYSFSEARQQKSVTVVELGKKGDLNVRYEELIPRYEMREIRGLYREIMAADFYRDFDVSHDYFHVILTDEDETTNARDKLRTVYKNILLFEYDNKRTKHAGGSSEADVKKLNSPFELFSEFFVSQNGVEMKNKQAEYVQKCIEDVWEGEKDEAD